MGLLDSVVGALGGAQGGGGGQADLLKIVVGMLGNDSQGGGLGGLVSQFERGGLGNVIGSWISSGQNLPISPDQLHNVLGSDTVANLARQAGLPAGDLTAQLSQMLPQIVDHLTPHGQVPQGGLGNVGDLLGALLKR